MTDPQAWPSEQVNLRLKNRTRTISIQPWGSFLTMPKSPTFQYRVLVGDIEQIARELSTGEAESVREPGKSFQFRGRKSTAYIYDDGNNISLEATVFEGETTFTPQLKLSKPYFATRPTQVF